MKPVFCFTILLLLPMAAFSLSIYISPLLYVDETGLSNRESHTVQSDLLSALWAVETGVVQFRRLRDNRINPPISLTDAAAVSRHEKVDYLLYGYVLRRTHNVQMEIRLFDAERRQVVQNFFSMDDSDNYYRMMEDMAFKIIVYLSDIFDLGIIPRRVGTTRISIPLAVGYWTPMQSRWTEVMLGTVAAGTGFYLIPNDNMFTIRGMRSYLSLGLEINYRFGVGDPSGHEAVKHTLYISIPLRLNIVFAGQHEVFAGLGVVNFFEIFLMADRHDDMQTHIFNNMGMNINIGYRFALTESFSIFFRNNFDFLFNEQTLITYSPVIGVNIQIFSRELRNRRW